MARRRPLSQWQVFDVRLQRYPNFSCTRKIESLRHHSKNVVSPAIEIERLTDYSNVSGEMFFPKTIADQRDRRPAGPIVIGRKRATEQWSHAQRN